MTDKNRYQGLRLSLLLVTSVLIGFGVGALGSYLYLYSDQVNYQKLLDVSFEDSQGGLSVQN